MTGPHATSAHDPLAGPDFGPAAGSSYPVVLCADDYGISAGVSAGIRELIARGRLSATSCMTIFAEWPDEARHLKALAKKADIGVHLTLTDHAPLAPMPRLAPEGRFPSLPRLVARSWTRQIARVATKAEIAAEINRQLGRFEEFWGGAPDFVDGHHHVHILPVVREAVIDAVLARYGRGRVYVRLCNARPSDVLQGAPWQAAMIGLMARGFVASAKRARLDGPADFRGMRNFAEARPYRALFRRYLRGIESGALIMCHPGHGDGVLAARDTVVAQREEEYAYLASEDFVADLATHNVRLARFADCGSRT